MFSVSSTAHPPLLHNQAAFSATGRTFCRQFRVGTASGDCKRPEIGPFSFSCDLIFRILKNPRCGTKIWIMHFWKKNRLYFLINTRSVAVKVPQLLRYNSGKFEYFNLKKEINLRVYFRATKPLFTEHTKQKHTGIMFSCLEVHSFSLRKLFVFSSLIPWLRKAAYKSVDLFSVPRFFVF